MWVTSLKISVNFTMLIERKLAAIMFTDIAGYTAQMSKDGPCLQSAYNQVQEKASEVDGKLAKKFLSYPIPKAIIEKYNKIKRDKD